MQDNQSEPTQGRGGVITAEEANKAAHPKGQKVVFSPAALAKRWDCCRQTIYNMIDDGQLHSFKVRNRRLIPMGEVERIENGEAG